MVRTVVLCFRVDYHQLHHNQEYPQYHHHSHYCLARYCWQDHFYLIFFPSNICHLSFTHWFTTSFIFVFLFSLYWFSYFLEIQQIQLILQSPHIVHFFLKILCSRISHWTHYLIISIPPSPLYIANKTSALNWCKCLYCL